MFIRDDETEHRKNTNRALYDAPDPRRWSRRNRLFSIEFRETRRNRNDSFITIIIIVVRAHNARDVIVGTDLEKKKKTKPT